MISLIFAFLAAIILFPRACLAVNFFDGAKPPVKSSYLLTYTGAYIADTYKDADGNTSVHDYGYKKFEEVIRYCYYTPDFVLTAFGAVGGVRSGLYNQSSGGMGDINIGAGGFLPIKQVDINPILFVKFPAAEYDAKKTVNYGTNQYDIKPCVFFYKDFGRITFDGCVKYFFRTKNPKNNTAAGDELHLQGLLGWELNKNCKFGPSACWMQSRRKEINDVKIQDSRKMYLAGGADVFFRLPKYTLTLTYLHDFRAKNYTKGDLAQVKTCYKF